jgi:hypothetical protein
MPEEWDRERYEREKRNFIAWRQRFRSVYFHTALIFSLTWLAGWLWSWALLKLGMANMPLRYAISFFLSYVVFVACVRVWADIVRAERGGQWDINALDFPSGDGEGCLVALAVLVLGLVAAGLFAMTGGLPLLLEVAFEVAFAGVVVRRLSYKVTLGNWVGALVKNTWIHALAALLVLLGIAAVLQAKAPAATTFAAAIKTLLVQPKP